MVQTYQSLFRTTLSLPVGASDTTITLAVAPTVTKGRMKIGIKPLEELISYDGVIGTTLQNVVRNLSKTAIPSTGGTGLSWIAGRPIKLVAMHDQLPDINEDTTYTGAVTAGGTVTTPDIRFTGTTTSGLRVKSLTTTQRDALTPATGDKIINTTTGTEQTYYGGTWNDAGTSTTPNASPTVAGKVEIATQTESDAGTPTGGTGAFLSPTPLEIGRSEQKRAWTLVTDAGGDDTYVGTLTPAPLALTAGMVFSIIVTTTNTGACTLDLNSTGAKSIKTSEGSDPSDGALRTDQATDLLYDGTNYIIQNVNYQVVNGVIKAGAYFGPGSDGNVTIGSNTTLVRDMYYNNLTISPTFTLNPDGYKIYVKGTLTNNGTIARNGNNASGITAGVILNQGSLNAETVGANGGAGGTGGGDGGNGGSGTSVNPGYLNTNGAAGGIGGNNSSSPTGGEGGTAGTAGTSTRGSMYNKILTFEELFLNYINPPSQNTSSTIFDAQYFNAAKYKGAPGSSGGGGGGSDTSGGAIGGNGGGAGGNGGVIWIAAKTFINNGTVSATGGTGGTGAAASGTVGSGGGGGGGGGNGGVFYLIYSIMATIGTVTLTGGAGGGGGAGSGGGQSGVAGTTGTTGTTIQIQIS